jgi:nucleotide-binding universal stress UspA family protein
MFKRITVAYSESPESRRALASAIHLARILGAELQAVTITVYGLAQNAPCSVLGVH